MERYKLSVVSLPSVDDIILTTNRRFGLVSKRGKFLEAKFRHPVDVFFAKITRTISSGISEIKVRGKEVVDSFLKKIDALLSEAESKLKEDFRHLLVRLNEYISTFYSEYLNMIFETIPKRVTVDEGAFILDSIMFTGKASLESGVKASLSELLSIVASGEAEIALDYKWEFLTA